MGGWSSLFEWLPAGTAGNIFTGEQEAIDTRRPLVMGEKRLIATIGVSEWIMVDTDDALLICTRERAGTRRPHAG